MATIDTNRTDQPAIRQAEPEDIPHIHHLLTELAAFVGESEHYSANLDSMGRHGFGDNRVFHTLLAWHQDRAVGLANYFPDYSTWRGMPGVYVLDLYVTEDFRGSGLGQRLLSETLERAEVAWEAGYVRLTVHNHNKAAVRFYNALGFSPADGELLMTVTRNELAGGMR